MESQELFANGPASAGPRRPAHAAPAPSERRERFALVTTVASILLPGAGHLLLRRPMMALGLIGAIAICVPASVALRVLLDDPWGRLGWWIGRIAVVAAVFAVADAPWSACERSAGLRRGGPDPRTIALLNAAGYGLGHLRLGETPAAVLAIVFGGGAHLASLLFVPAPWMVLTEGLPLLLGYWGYRTAQEITPARRITTELGGLDRSGPTRLRRGIEPPPWWMVSTVAASLLWFVGALSVWNTGSEWRASVRVDQTRTVEVEPYYRNPRYGLHVEMPSPGWSLRRTDAASFFTARHSAESVTMDLSLRPRLPFGDDDVEAAAAELRRLEAEGLRVEVVEEGPSELAGRPAFRVRGRGVRDGEPRELELRLLASGPRRYVLRTEWDPRHAAFARSELRGVLAKLRIENDGAPSSSTSAR